MDLDVREHGWLAGRCNGGWVALASAPSGHAPGALPAMCSLCCVPHTHTPSPPPLPCSSILRQDACDEVVAAPRPLPTANGMMPYGKPACQPDPASPSRPLLMPLVPTHLHAHMHTLPAPAAPARAGCAARPRLLRRRRRAVLLRAGQVPQDTRARGLPSLDPAAADWAAHGGQLHDWQGRWVGRPGAAAVESR